jgi:hypothetical protein
MGAVPTETLTPARVKAHLDELLEERALARTGPLGHNATYMADLDAEIDACHAAYVGVAVTEIAVRRSMQHGPLRG